MNKPWRADIDISRELAEALLHDQFPSLFPLNIQSFGEGWDNVAFLVNRQFVFRFPRRRIAVPLLRRELLALPTLVQQLDIPCPNPIFVGTPDERYPWPFLGYELLRGRTACRVALAHEQRLTWAESLGQFLAQLHRLGDADFAAHLPMDEFGKTDPRNLSQKILQYAESMGDRLRPEEDRRIGELLERLPKRRARQNQLVHGDFYVRHLLADEMGAWTGVIDWGDIHLGDPAVDLSIAWSFLPRQAHDAFRQAYGKIDAETWYLARMRALLYGLILTLYGSDLPDADLEREGLDTLGKVLAPTP